MKKVCKQEMCPVVASAGATELLVAHDTDHMEGLMNIISQYHYTILTNLEK